MEQILSQSPQKEPTLLTLISELWDSFCCFKPSSSWYFVMAAVGMNTLPNPSEPQFNSMFNEGTSNIYSQAFSEMFL